jgi:DNA transposition AAA+ family ATPase
MQNNTKTPRPERQLPVPASEAAKASSAKSRINVPFNLGNWKELDEDTTQTLAWFHQHALENDLGWKEAEAALGYDKSTIFRVLKGTYEGNLANVTGAIVSYRRIAAERLAIKHAAFRETRITRLVCGGLSYAMANNSITVITGESRMGKTESGKWWRDQNNHGRTVFVTAPPIGGAKGLLLAIARALGINQNLSSLNMSQAIYRAFNENRMLIIDEAHRMLPSDKRANPTLLEIVRDIHDLTRCGLAFLCTRRFEDVLAKSEYQFEQVLGRIGMPVQLPRDLEWDDIEPIVAQYVEGMPAALRSELLKIANGRGRLGILCEVLKFASRIATKASEPLTAATVQTAIAARRQMMGETQWARK